MHRFVSRHRFAGCLYLTLLLGAAAAGVRAADSPPVYETIPASPDGIGVRYMGREIARVMGWQAADWLERDEREAEERTDVLVQELHLSPGMRVADVGAGTGYVSRRIARVVGPQGSVEAVDVQPQMIERLADLARRENLPQIHPVLGAVDDVHLAPDSVDMAIMVDVYHELQHPYEMLASIVRAVRPGGHVVFVEYRAEDPNVPIKRLHTMSVEQVDREALVLPLHFERVAEPLPWQHIIVFRKDAGAGPASDADLPAPLRAVIAGRHPGSHVVAPGETRYTDCAAGKNPGPGWFAADLDGKGRTDYAVLLVSDQPTWTVHLDDQDYPTYDARVLAYLAQPDGSLLEREVYAFHESLPTVRGIAPHAPGKVRDAPSGRATQLQTTGIDFVSCGQFEVVYYWHGRGFEHASLTP
jgi:ubiquinone/menaquinone biosynthesis C-methylase UbiE